MKRITDSTRHQRGMDIPAHEVQVTINPVVISTNCTHIVFRQTVLVGMFQALLERSLTDILYNKCKHPVVTVTMYLWKCAAMLIASTSAITCTLVINIVMTTTMVTYVSTSIECTPFGYNPLTLL